MYETITLKLSISQVELLCRALEAYFTDREWEHAFEEAKAVREILKQITGE